LLYEILIWIVNATREFAGDQSQVLPDVFSPTRFGDWRFLG
jgi:hypothetical protein